MSYYNNIQFTELTLDDVTIQEDLYTELLSTYSSIEIQQQSGIIPAAIYYDYAAKELQKSKQLLWRTFK